MKFNRKRVILAVALCSLMCVAVLYVAQAHYGICLKEGRVLSPEELRQRVLLNLVNFEIQSSSDFNGFIGKNRSLVGIANSVSEIDIKKIMEKIYSENSVEISLELEPLIKEGRYEKAKQYLASQIKEPFILVQYSVNNNVEDGTIYISPNVIKGFYKPAENKKNKLGLIESLRNYIGQFSKSLCGFNNHYYKIPRFSFSRACCDNKLSVEALNEERRKSFEKNIELIEKYKTPGRYIPPHISAISNCGDILIEPHDMGLPIHVLHRVDRIN
jgi:hypothetical protein